MKNFIVLVIVTFILIGCSRREVGYESYGKPLEQSSANAFDYFMNGSNDLPVSEIPQRPSELPPISDETLLEKDAKKKIAVVFPSKIVGKYASGTINTVLSQMLFDNVSFDLEVIDTFDESAVNIEKAINELDEKNYKNVLMFITNTGL